MLLDDVNNPVQAYDLYLANYYWSDPIYRRWCEDCASGILSYCEVKKSRLANSAYYADYLPKASISDDLSVSLPIAGAAAMVLALERSEGVFSKSEIELLRRVFPTILGLHKAHISQVLFSVCGSGLGSTDPNTLRALMIVDRYDRIVFANEGWKELAIDRRRFERIAVEADPERLTNISVTKDLTLRVVPLSPDFAVAPGGKVYVIEPGVRQVTPSDFDNMVLQFLPSDLTRREREIARYILDGYPTKLIARYLSITEGAVRNHRQRLYNKLDITTERELFTSFLKYLMLCGY